MEHSSRSGFPGFAALWIVLSCGVACGDDAGGGGRDMGPLIPAIQLDSGRPRPDSGTTFPETDSGSAPPRPDSGTMPPDVDGSLPGVDAGREPDGALPPREDAAIPVTCPAGLTPTPEGRCQRVYYMSTAADWSGTAHFECDVGHHVQMWGGGGGYYGFRWADLGSLLGPTASVTRVDIELYTGLFCDQVSPRPISRPTTLNGVPLGAIRIPDTTTRATSCECAGSPGYVSMLVQFLDPALARSVYLLGGENTVRIEGALDSEGLDVAPLTAGWLPGAYARVTVTY